MKEVPTFETKCASCGLIFGRAQLSDFEYGLAYAFLSDGSRTIEIDAFAAFPRRIEAIAPDLVEDFFHVLARLADTPAGTQMLLKLGCPRCSSTEFEYWGGKVIGTDFVYPAEYTRADRLQDEELLKIIYGNASCLA